MKVFVCGLIEETMARLCGRWSFKVNSLWQWGYCLLVLMGEGYLMYRAVQKCQEYNELRWVTEQKPVAELYVYISMIVISIMCIPFFFITAIFQVGNYPNDGMRLGRDDVKDLPAAGGVDPGGGEMERESEEDRNPTKLQVLWRHSGPLAVGFHIVASFTLLLPVVLMDAQKVKYGFLSTG